MKFVGSDHSAMDVQVWRGRLVIAVWNSSGRNVRVRLNKRQARALSAYIRKIMDSQPGESDV